MKAQKPGVITTALRGGGGAEPKVTWETLEDLTGEERRNLRAYGITAEAAYKAMEAIVTSAGFESLEEAIEACADKISVLDYLAELSEGAKPEEPEEEETEDEVRPRRGAVREERRTPARREAPSKGKPAARKPAKDDEVTRLKARIDRAKKEGKRRLAAELEDELEQLQAEAERMSYPDAGKVVGDGEEPVADYAVFDSEDLQEFGNIRWQNKTDDDGNRLPDRLRAIVQFADDQVLTVTVRKDGLGEVPGRERGEAVMEVLSGGFYAIDFPAENGDANGGLFLDCNPEVSGGRQFNFDEEGRLVWGSKSRTQFFRHSRKPANEGDKAAGKARRTEEPQAQSFRPRRKARR